MQLLKSRPTFNAHSGPPIAVDVSSYLDETHSGSPPNFSATSTVASEQQLTSAALPHLTALL